MAHQWRGVIREYADRLPVTESTKVITLGEGGTPLVHAQKLSELTGSTVYLKVDPVSSESFCAWTSGVPPSPRVKIGRASCRERV